MRQVLALSICVLLGVSQSYEGAYAAEPEGLVAVPASVASQPSVESAELVATREQIRQLQTQVQVMKEYHGALLDTVYWALGGVFFVTSAILGFGWFANFKVYGRDKLALKEDLAAKTASIASDNAAAIAKLNSETKDAVNEMYRQIESVLSGQITSEIAQKIDPVNDSIQRVDKRVFTLELHRKKEKMRSAVPDSIALSDALGLLELCQKRAEDEVPEIIKFMLEKLSNGGRLTAGEITRANAVIDTLPPHYKALCDRLRTQLVASEIF